MVGNGNNFMKNYYNYENCDNENDDKENMEKNEEIIVEKDNIKCHKGSSRK